MECEKCGFILWSSDKGICPSDSCKIEEVIPEEIIIVIDDSVNDEDAPTKTLDEVSKEYILKVFNHFKGNKMKAAELLGVTSKTLYNKLTSWGLHNPRK